jgi:hypothetical protein
MLKVTISFALLLMAAAPTAAQETPAPVNAEDIKLTATPNVSHNETTTSSSTTDVAPTESAPQKVDPPPAIGSTTAPAEKPAVKRAVAARTATRARASVAASARVGPYPGYATGF